MRRGCGADIKLATSERTPLQLVSFGLTKRHTVVILARLIMFLPAIIHLIGFILVLGYGNNYYFHLRVLITLVYTLKFEG